MNEQLPNHTNPEDENIARKLKRVAEETHANAQFAAELEERLRSASQAKKGPFTAAFKSIAPVLRWAAFMILLAIALSWSIRTLILAPQPASENTPTAAVIVTSTPKALTPPVTSTPQGQAEYDWRGGKLFLNAPLPASPAEASVYLLQPDQLATVEGAQSLAQRFGIAGVVYEAPGELPYTTNFMITDGKQRLYVRSENYFTYYADYGANYGMNTFLLGDSLSEEEARAAIDAFLGSHGFDFAYQVEKQPELPGFYYVIPTTADGRAVRFDHNLPSRLQITLGRDGQVLSLDSNQIDYTPVGAYGIISAEEAFQQVLGNAEVIQNGVLESSRTGGALHESYWERTYPDDETITIYGRVTVFPAVDPGAPAFTAIDNYTATDNLPSATSDQLIEATGQFHTENGIRTFHVETWKATDAMEVYISGTLQREGDQFLLTISDTGTDHQAPLVGAGKQYPLLDAPADLPLDTEPSDEQLNVSGVLANGTLHWKSIQYFPQGSNFGGGGGAGTGFYQINLSGTPVAFPTPTMQPGADQGATGYVVQNGDTCVGIASSFAVSLQSLIDANQLSAECLIQVGQTLTIPGTPGQSLLVGQTLEKQRGVLSIYIYQHPDGTSRPEFTYTTQVSDTYLYATLENVTLEEMLPYQNLPLDMWGTIKSVDAYGAAVISVERFEAAYPGLEFQLIRGTQHNSEIEGSPVVLFIAEDGQTYVQMTRDGALNTSIVGEAGDPVLAEALLPPDQTFGGYPVMQFFRMEAATNPGDSGPDSLIVTANQPQVLDASLDPPSYAPPDTVIEKVELVYYTPDPRYRLPEASPGPQYIQPAWRFYGHNSNGDVFEILVQALKREFLRPELQTYTPPG